MLHRCYNPKNEKYSIYGARGIKVCAAWKNDFWTYVEFFRHPPFENASIDRINPDGDYEPTNCRWATSKTQSRNRRETIQLTFHGITKSLADWADDLGLPYGRVKSRWNYGYSVEKILSPVLIAKKYRIGNKMGWMVDGEFVSYKQIAVVYNMAESTVKARYCKGWSYEKTISQPVRERRGGNGN
jgi:hypothetical protein